MESSQVRGCFVLLLGFVPACTSDEQAGASLVAASSSSGSTGTTGSSGPGELPTTTLSSTEGGESTSTGAEEATGTTGVVGCGDGVVGPGEECDDGFAANVTTGTCLPNCVLARCGDGFVQAGVEHCDSGSENGHAYGGCLPFSCHWGEHCGDGIVTPLYELCDPAAPQEAEGQVACGPTCRFAGRVVFLSSQAYSGDLGGVSGADLKCQALARAFDPERYYNYRAWLSDGVNAPAGTFAHGPEFAETPYVLLSGVAVAASFAGLVQTGPEVGITITDERQSVVEARVWTHTTHAGESIPDDHHCEQWTTSELGGAAMAGLNALADESPDQQQWSDERWWTRRTEYWCSFSLHLYCFEN